MYVLINNGEIEKFPYSIGDLRKDNPNTSFPKFPSEELLAEWNVYPVTLGQMPAYDTATQEVSRNETPELNSEGAWVLNFNVNPKSAETIAYEEAEVRRKRNRELRDTDYLALSDTTLTPEMAAYRQALRDITSHANFPNLQDEDWPVKPQ